jgi:hypothetical protein
MTIAITIAVTVVDPLNIQRRDEPKWLKVLELA